MSEVNLSLIEVIRNTYPELTDADFSLHGSIEMRDDSDGQGAYIANWNYSKPIPDGLQLGK